MAHDDNRLPPDESGQAHDPDTAHDTADTPSHLPGDAPDPASDDAVAGQSASDAPELIVGIGASAGGLEALERFFDAMRPDANMAFVVIQHLSPDFKSLMTELLARHTTMAIKRVEDREQVRRNTVYLIPPKTEMVISSGRLLLTDKARDANLSLPIDMFFKSLARDVGLHGVAVVLSGSGTDGSRGVVDLHEAGGIVMVQDPETAKFDSMPRSAIATGVVDFILPPEAMPDVLTTLSERPRHLPPRLPAAQPPAPEVQRFRDIFRLLHERYGIDFAFYKPTTIGRRIDRRMNLQGVTHLHEYLAMLQRSKRDLDTLYRDLLIEVTSFFRDPEAFERLATEVVDPLVGEADPTDQIRVWVSGCATGEEAYSLAMLFQEAMDKLGELREVKIFATDLHRGSLQIAAAGLYPAEAVIQLSQARRERFFSRENDHFRVIPELRKLIVFAEHNLIKDPPFTKLDLLVCRNLLIYLQPIAQKKVMFLFHFALRANGYLFLGPSETLGELREEFEPLDRHWKIFRKNGGMFLPPQTRFSPSEMQRSDPLSLPMPSAPPAQGAGHYDPVLMGAYDLLLERYMPPGMLLDSGRRVIHIFGAGQDYLRPARGRQNWDLLEMVDGELKLALGAALQRAQRERSRVSFQGVRFERPGGEERLDVIAEYLERRGKGFYLVLLEQVTGPVSEDAQPSEPAAQVAPVQPARPPKAVKVVEAKGGAKGADEIEVTSGSFDPEAVSQQRIHQLEQELQYTRENLQSAVEELESSNEELQSTNEELLASNEELQSTNEELHSVNEELYTVNAEYERKIQELTQLTRDEDNLLRSTEIGTVFLDTALRIRKFTPQIAAAFNLMAQDVGRPIDHIASSIKGLDVARILRGVLDSGKPVEREVESNSGAWYLMRVLPYRVEAGRIGGVVLTFLDISTRKAMEQELQDSYELTKRRSEELEALFEASRSVLAHSDFSRAAAIIFDQLAQHMEARSGYLLECEEDGRHRVTSSMGFGWERGAPAEVVDGLCRALENHADTLHGARLLVSGDRELRQEFWPHKRRKGKGVPRQILLAPMRVRDAMLGCMVLADVADDFGEDMVRVAESFAELAAIALNNARTVRALARSEERYRMALAHAESASKAKSEFLANMSHEIRTPINGVIGMLTLLNRSGLGEEQHVYMDNALAAARGLLSIINDVLDFSKIEAGTIDLVHDAFSLTDLLNQLAAMFRPQMDEKGLEFVTELEDGAPRRLVGDLGRLRQILVNLVGNAVKFTDSGEVRVRVAAVGEPSSKGGHGHQQLLFTVADTGIGIPTKRIRELFNPFTQGDGSYARRYNGVGLGLGIVKRLVDLLGGTITVDSDVGMGTEIHVSLSYALPEAETGQDLVQVAVLPGKLKLLLVEDNYINRLYLQTLLSSQGHEIHEAENGREALEVLARERFDAVLMDVQMPEMDGMEATRRIRADRSGDFDPNIPIVALTAHAMLGEREQFLEVGMNGYIAKPVEAEGVVTELARVLDLEVQHRAAPPKGEGGEGGEGGGGGEG